MLASVMLLAACSGESAPSGAPQNFSVTAGDGQVVVHFTQEAGKTYWVFLAQGDSGINRSTYVSAPGARVVWPVNDGGIVSGLTNGQVYSFFMNASNGNGPAGPETGTLVATPRLAGSTWTANTPIGTTGADTKGIAFGLSDFMTVSRDGNAYISTDGKTWTATTSSPSIGPLNSVAFNGTSSIFVAVGDNGVISSSSDAATWTTRTSNTTAKLNGVSAVGGSYVAVGDGGTIIGTSDYTNWVVRTSGVTANLHNVKYVGGSFVAVGDNGTIVSSPDGFTWTVQTSGTTANLYDVAYGTDSATSTALYMAVGANGTILTSTDLTTWTAEAPVTSNTLYGVVYGSQFMIVGSGGLVMYATDGSTWTAPTSAVTGDLLSVIYALGEYLTVGVGGVNQFSS